MSNNNYLGYNAEKLETAPAFLPYSKVIAWYDDENAFTAGDDSGRTLQVDLPFATQEIVDKMLERIRGYTYQPWAGSGAILDPAAELGDGVTVNGVYSVLASMETDFNALMVSYVAAPADDEVDHEYPYLTPTNRALRRKVTLGANYYGTRITRKNGLEIVKTAADGTEKSRVILNADLLAFYNDDGEEALYFDAEAGKFKFRGLLNVSDNFIVNDKGDVTIKGSLNMETGTITGPKIAGGKIMDLQQQTYLQMGSDAGAGTIYGYLNMFVPAYDSVSPMFSAYCRYNQTSGVKGIALRATGKDFLVVDGSGVVFPTGEWDFSAASVSRFSASRIDTGRVIVEELDDYDLRLYSEYGRIRMAAPNGDITFFVNGVTWILDDTGLHQPEE